MGFYENQEKILAFANNYPADPGRVIDNIQPEQRLVAFYLCFVLETFIKVYVLWVGMRVILINTPAFQKIEDYDCPDYPHIGLGYIAAWLEKHNIDVHVIDAKLERLDIPATLDKTKKLNPNIVGITSMTHDFSEAVKLAGDIKKYNNQIKTIIGGIHATALPFETLRDNKEFDYIVYGEGEDTILELVQSLKKNKGLRNIKGLGYREKNGKIRINPPRTLVKELDRYPMPAWHLFPGLRLTT